METLCLLCCVLSAAPPAPVPPGSPPSGRAGSWLLVPHLSASQELVYGGTFAEEGVGSVQFSRRYHLASRVFVLGADAKGQDVAVLTVLKDDPAAGAASAAPRPGAGPPALSARLERVRVDVQGNVSPAKGVSLTVPLEGPPTVECGAFVPLPPGRVHADRPWVVREWGRPDWRWRADGTEAVNGTLCVKLVGVQQSPDWDEPRGPRRAWRRHETAWVAVRAGVAYRVERVIECKEPGRRDVAQRSVLRYDLEFSPRLPAPMGEERRRDISQALQFAESAGPLVAEPARHGPQLTALLERIDGYLERQLAATPYRDAVLAIRARVAAARRGETPPALPSELTTPTGGEKEGPTEAVLNAPAPDFLAPDWTNPAKSATLRNWRGRPVLMVFYSPASPNLDDLMRLVQKLAAKHKEVAVVALAMSGDAAAAIKQRGEKQWQFPVLDGRGLRGSYAVDGTPKLVMIDAGGVVRGTVVGWGDETAAEVAAAVPRWLRTR